MRRDRTGRRGRRRGLHAAAALWLLAALVPAGRGAAQSPLTLEGALGRATTDAYAVRIAEGETVERSGDRLRALQGILPTVRFESGFLRTTDPVAAFGLSLRQRTITQEDFAPTRLNHPPVGEDWAGAVVVEVPLLNPDAWLGLSAAGRATSANAAAAVWTARSTRADVVRAYYGAVLAAETVATLEAAAEAAAAHIRQAELMVEQGLVTKSDALLARVKAGEVDAELAGARGAARTAVRQLAVLLGAPEERPVLPDGLPPADVVRSVIGAGDASLASSAGRGLLSGSVSEALGARADVRAARLGRSAARRDVQRARSTWLPRVNAFGRYDWHSLDGLYAGDESWTVGIMARWTPLAGAAHAAESRSASGRREVAEAKAEAAVASARLEVETTGDELRAALERLAIAERSVEHAAEAHRIVSRKYEGGLATVVELLDASTTETRTRLERSAAIYRVIEAGAKRALALGRDPGVFAVLDGTLSTNRTEADAE